MTDVRSAGSLTPRRVNMTDAVRLASLGIVGFMSLLAVTALATQVDQALRPSVRVVGTLITVWVAGCFLACQRRWINGRRTRSMNVLAALVIMLGVVNVQLTQTWTLLGISTATAMLLTTSWWSVALAAVVFLVGGADVVLESHSLVTQIGIPVTTLITALVLYTLTRLATALREAAVSHEELARMHVDDERTRIFRDLHDIIGRTLVSASLRNQTALQLIDRDVDRAREQLEQVHESLAHGQTQLRGLTHGPVSSDLQAELSAARALCARLGIRCSVNDIPVPESVSPQGGMVVREAITNMLKHSSPMECQIDIRRVSEGFEVSVTNDGCLPHLSSIGVSSGTGLPGLRARIERLGGSLTAGPIDGARFRTCVLIVPAGSAGGAR